PAVNRSEQFACLLRLTLFAPEPREAHRGAEFPGFRLLARDGESVLEKLLRLRCTSLRRYQCNFACDAMNLGLGPHFLRCICRGDRFVDAAPSIVELSEFRISPRQR